MPRPQPSLRARLPALKLTAPGWNPPTRRALERIIRRGAGRGLPVVFDFDNTIVRGDIGEAVLAQLARTGRLVPARIPREICPPLARPEGGTLAIRDCASVTDFYERMLSPTVHGREDPTPLANGYAWAVQVMSGLPLAEVVAATREVLALAGPGAPATIQPGPGSGSFAVPQFHPEMVELIAVLLRHEFQVWIVSASNVWSVRWLVLHGLNPLLAEHEGSPGLAPERVIGVATLLTDASGRWFKDSVLVRQNPRHATFADPATLALRLTSLLQLPVPAYSGKVACILDAIGRRPFLCAGDGSGDHAMLALSEHRLWIARLREPAGPRKQGRKPAVSLGDDWLLQATRDGPQAGFLSEAEAPPPEVSAPTLARFAGRARAARV